MRERLHKTVIPAYVLLCLLLGGSAQGTWTNMALQILAVGVIAWAAFSPQREPLTGGSKLLLLLAILGIGLAVLQLVPLPPAVWTSLPGREPTEIGYRSIGLPLPWLPISLAPYETLATALTLLPPLAVLVGVTRLRAYQESRLAGALLIGAFLSVFLGAIQTVGGNRSGGWWYLYDITSTGAVGFFANRNHMGTLLLVTIPFAVALFASGNSGIRDHGRSQAMLAIGAGGILVVLVGLALNGSLAALALTLPTILFSALIPPGHWRGRRLALPLAALAIVSAVLVFTSNPIRSELADSDTTSFDTRLIIWDRSAAAIADTFPVGTGLGSFEQVYRLHEDPRAIDRTYVNHAHNDYLELSLENGLAGMLLMIALLLWWVIETANVWRSRLGSHFARAATIASGVVLAHSIVDYPLRTAGMAAVFAASLAVMAQPSRQRRTDDPLELRPSKHLTIG